LLGNLRKMENTQHPLLTMPSLLAQPTATLKHSSGNLGHRLNVNFSAGLLFKTKYGPPTDWKLGGGQTKEPAHNVGFMRRHACTFSGIAGSRSACGRKSPPGHKTTTCIRVHGHLVRRLRSGGWRCQMRRVRVRKAYARSSY